MRTDLADLWPLLAPRLQEFGISRVADTTGLDRVGIPTASVVRPGTADVIWVYSGKGHSAEAARAGAIMECVERCSTLWPTTGSSTPATIAETRARMTAWGPDEFTELPTPSVGHVAIPWSVGTCVSTGGPVALPADLVHSGRRPSFVGGHQPFPARTSNGIAAAFDFDGALTRALLEVAERDIVSQYQVRASHSGVAFIASLSQELGIATPWLAGSYADDIDAAPTVSHASLPEGPARLTDRFTRVGLFCDWYVELKKLRFREGSGLDSNWKNILFVFDSALRLLHPSMPFITEEIWQRLRNQGPEGNASISLAAFPLGDASRHDAAAELEMGILQDIITSVRTLRAEMKVDPKLALTGVLYSTTGAVALASREQEAITKLANVKLELKAEPAPKTGAATRSTPHFDLVLIVPAAQQDAQITRLRKENEQLEKNIASTERQLGDEKFMGKAPPQIVSSMQQKLAEYRTQLAKNQDALRALEA